MDFSCQLYQDNGYTYKPATDCLQWLHTYFNYLCFPGYQWCSVASCIRTMATPTNLSQTVSSGYTPTSTIFVFQDTSGVQWSGACHRLSPVASHLLKLSLFSRLPVVFSCQLYQDNVYTYITCHRLSPVATHLLQLSLFFQVSCCVQLSPVASHLHVLQLSLFSRLPVVLSCQLPVHTHLL